MLGNWAKFNSGFGKFDSRRGATTAQVEPPLLHLQTQYQADEFCLTAESGLGKNPL